MTSSIGHSGWKRSILPSTALAATCLISTPALAYNFKLGEVDVTVDSSVSVGASWRTESNSRDSLPVAEGGNLHTSNYDNGLHNWKSGDTISKVFKGVHDIEFRYGNFGAFVRGRYWYDFELRDEQSQRRYELPDDALDDAAAGTELLDAFVWANFDLPGFGDSESMPATVRYGRQVVSWGESTFIQHGINTINPVDVSAFRKPGAQLKEALLPVEMLYGSFGLTDNLSMELFYKAKWEKNRIDGCNTFFQAIDYAAPGCNTLDASFGFLTQEQSEAGAAIPLFPGLPDINTHIPRAADIEPDDDGQYGVAFRYYADWLNDGTELGLYYVKYHADRPMVGAYGADPAVALATVPTLGYANLGMEYFIEYPEGIDMFGVSFNTTVGNTAVSGEFSIRPNMPVQKSLPPALWAALNPLSTSLGFPEGTIGALSQYDAAQAPGDKIDAYKRFPVIQGQMTLIHFFEQVMGAERMTLIAEAGFTRVNGAPSRDEFSFTGPLGTDVLMPPSQYNTVPGLAACGATTFPTDKCSKHGTGDSFSWGYRVLAELEYSNWISGIIFKPSIFFTHDVEGTTPAPMFNFVEDTMSVGLSLKADYLNKLTVDLSYTNFFGGQEFNGYTLNAMQDRDFASLSMTYSF